MLSNCGEGALMVDPTIDFPINDADNHMYETTDAFTKFLPQGVRRAHQVRRR